MDMQPGQLIVPHGDGSDSSSAQPPAAGAPPEPERPAEQPLPPAPAPAPPTEPANPPQSLVQVPAQAPQDQNGLTPALPTVPPQAGWGAADDYDVSSVSGSGMGQTPGDLSWTAAEFTGHQKSAAWYGLVIIGGFALAGLYYWIARDTIFTAVIVLVILMAVTYASHKPHSEAYHLSPRGVQIGNRMYGFQQFKNFSVTDDGSVASVILAPLGRVSLPITISVPTDMEEKVLGYLSLFLPFEEHRTDAVDGLLRRIKF